MKRTGADKAAEYDAKFPDYGGTCIWEVRHPDYPKSCKVLAPIAYSRNEVAPIVTAASYWGRRWQDIEFYAYCECTRIK